MDDVHGVADLPAAPAPGGSRERVNEVVPAWFVRLRWERPLGQVRALAAKRPEAKIVGWLLRLFAGLRRVAGQCRRWRRSSGCVKGSRPRHHDDRRAALRASTVGAHGSHGHHVTPRCE